MRLNLCVALFVLGAQAGCADESPPPTTPRRIAAPASSDGYAPPGAPPGARSGDQGGAESGAGVPSGLDMRVGGGGSGAGARPATGAGGGLEEGGGGQGAADPRKLPPPWIGGAGAKVVIEEFSNFECPFCRVGAKTMKRVLDHYGAKVKVIYRHLPLAYQAQAKLAAQAAVCAQAQGKFWPMKALLFEHYDALSRADLLGYARRLGLDVPRFTRDLDGGACLPRVEEDLAEARKRVIEGTPAYFINGTKHEGALPFDTFRKLIDAALAE
ncbi:MAG: thioredoxin domain-containing protein [Polyangia bacterium]|jgi:protein-disulfide isomerase|nr:thioredoxin domain-containing protein [Polyangia bacterium]